MEVKLLARLCVQASRNLRGSGHDLKREETCSAYHGETFACFRRLKHPGGRCAFDDRIGSSASKTTRRYEIIVGQGVASAALFVDA